MTEFAGIKINKLPVEPGSFEAAASADQLPDFLEHARKRAVESVMRGETVALTCGGKVIAILGPQLPFGGVREGDPRFHSILAQSTTLGE